MNCKSFSQATIVGLVFSVIGIFPVFADRSEAEDRVFSEEYIVGKYGRIFEYSTIGNARPCPSILEHFDRGSKSFTSNAWVVPHDKIKADQALCDDRGVLALNSFTRSSNMPSPVGKIRIARETFELMRQDSTGFWMGADVRQCGRWTFPHPTFVFFVKEFDRSILTSFRVRLGPEKKYMFVISEKFTCIYEDVPNIDGSDVQVAGGASNGSSSGGSSQNGISSNGGPSQTEDGSSSSSETNSDRPNPSGANSEGGSTSSSGTSSNGTQPPTTSNGNASSQSGANTDGDSSGSGNNIGIGSGNGANNENGSDNDQTSSGQTSGDSSGNTTSNVSGSENSSPVGVPPVPVITPTPPQTQTQPQKLPQTPASDNNNSGSPDTSDAVDRDPVTNAPSTSSGTISSSSTGESSIQSPSGSTGGSESPIGSNGESSDGDSSSISDSGVSGSGESAVDTSTEAPIEPNDEDSVSDGPSIIDIANGAAPPSQTPSPDSDNSIADIASENGVTVGDDDNSPETTTTGDNPDEVVQNDPNAATTLEPNAGESLCFPGNATVMTRNGRHVRMDHLRVGDEVLVGEGIFSQVFMFSHEERQRRARFIRLLTTGGLSIELTEGHLLYVGDVLKAARDVRVGNTIQDSSRKQHRVVNVKTVWRAGVFNPQTVSGDLVVNGILTSTYTTTFGSQCSHTLLVPVRVMWKIAKIRVVERIILSTLGRTAMKRWVQPLLTTAGRVYTGKAW